MMQKAEAPPDLDPGILAEKYVDEVKQEVQALGATMKVVGLIATRDKPSLAYARATQQKFNDIGIEYDLRPVERLELETEILRANEDVTVHGVFIYFPVFNSQQDDYLRNQVDYRKDIEAGSIYWTRKLYDNDRYALGPDEGKKALIPCTPLAIVKILTEVGVYAAGVDRPIAGKKVTIFNRSEVVGRPLAVMMSNDGAKVVSFDLNGPLVFINSIPHESSITRAEALRQSDIVITGVPGDSFQKISASEIDPGTICLNFSSSPNFEDDVNTHTDIYIPRVGPMTVAMCMRNLIRLYNIFHVTATDGK